MATDALEAWRRPRTRRRVLVPFLPALRWQGGRQGHLPEHARGDPRRGRATLAGSGAGPDRREGVTCPGT